MSQAQGETGKHSPFRGRIPEEMAEEQRDKGEECNRVDACGLQQVAKGNLLVLLFIIPKPNKSKRRLVRLVRDQPRFI